MQPPSNELYPAKYLVMYNINALKLEITLC